MKLEKFIGIKISHRNGCRKVKGRVNVVELIIWMFMALGIVILSVIVVLRGISQRVNKPNDELKEQVTSLESRVRELEDGKE